jgi:hypothetical protein
MQVIFDRTIRLLSLLAVLCPILALADYHYASHAGSNTPPYESWASAADSIQKAINASSPHDTVYISAGDWYETDTTEMSDSVAIIGAGMDSTFWYGDAYQTGVLMLDYNCSVENVTFKHLNHYNAVFGMPDASIRVNNCRFLQTGAGIAASGGYTEITNCIFDSCSRGITMYNGHVPYVYIANNYLRQIYGNVGIENLADSAVIENNIILCDTTSSFPIGITTSTLAGRRVVRNNFTKWGIGGINVIASKNSNNTIRDIKWHGLGMEITYNMPSINNSIVNCYKGMALFGDSTTVNYCNLWNITINFEGIPGESIGNIYADPMYISDSDFHLQMYSPLIDAGDPNILDVDGSRSDIGAYGGPEGTSYIYQDLPPRIPDSLRGNYNQDTIRLRWTYNTEADFYRYLLYRDTVPGFTPSTLYLIAQPESSIYVDTDVSNQHNYYYRVSAADNQDNVSDYSPELPVITTDIWDQAGAELPQITAISSNYPNPFNLSTIVVYRVANLGPQPAKIEIDIYDVVGRKVRTLVNERKEAGEHRIIWDGRDDNGGQLSSGVYFARISQWGLALSGQPRKLVLIK